MINHLLLLMYTSSAIFSSLSDSLSTFLLDGKSELPLCCLFFFDIRILIVPLVSSNSSCYELTTSKLYAGPMRGGSAGTSVRSTESQEGACAFLKGPIALAIDILFLFFHFLFDIFNYF